MPEDFRPAGWTGQPSSDPDVRPVGWVTEQPTVTVYRRRSPLLLVVGLVLVSAAAVALGISIVDLATTSAFAEEDVVAEGTVSALGEPATEVATFTAGGDDPFTVWIQTDGIFEEHRRDNVVAATACVADLPGDDDADFQGNRQGNAVTVGDDSTVGWFTASEGQVSVACHQEPFGQRRTRGWLEDEHGFLVVAGKSGGPWAEIIVLTVVAGVLVLGIGVLARWRRGRVEAI